MNVYLDRQRGGTPINLKTFFNATGVENIREAENLFRTDNICMKSNEICSFSPWLLPSLCLPK